MSGEHITLLIVCGLMVVQQVVHMLNVNAHRKQVEIFAKLLAARNYTDYSVGEARQIKAAKAAEAGAEGYGSAFTDG